MDTRKTVMLGIKRGGLLALLLGFAFWPALTGGRTKLAAPAEAPARFQRATAQPSESFEVSAVAVKGSVVFAAAGGSCGEREGGGVFRSTDGGESWTPLDDGQMSRSVRSLMVARSGALFAGTHDGVFRSADLGNTWTPTGLLGVDISTMASGPDVLFAADGCRCSGVYRSTDEGDSWQKVNEGLTACVRGLAVDPAGAVFAATAAHGVYRSTDNGDGWAPANAGLPTFDLKTVAVDGEGHVFVGSASDGVFRSTDGAMSWAHVGLSGLRVNTLAIRAGSGIFAGTDSAVYRSADDGYSWNAVDLGLSEPAEIRALALGKHGMAFAAAGRNVLRTTLAARAGSGGGLVTTSLLVAASPTADSAASASGKAVTSLTWSHTVGNADPNRILIVGTSNTGNKTVTAVTYGGVPLTRQGFLSNGNVNRVEVWSLLAPAAGTASVVVTLSGSTDAAAGSISFFGVDQTTPLGTFASASGTTTNPSVFVSTNSGAVVIATLAAGGDAVSATVGSLQTSQWNLTTGATSTNVIGAGSTEATTGASLTMSWTLAAAKAWSLGAISVNPVGVLPACVLGYPSGIHLPRSTTVFAENVVLRGVQGPVQCSPGQTAAIVAFYNDEHAITLGVRQVVVITGKACSGGTSPGSPCTANNQCGKGGTCVGTGATTNYPVSPLNTSPSRASNAVPLPPGAVAMATGTTIANGNQAGTDVNTCNGGTDPNGCGRPMWPALFITDITDNPSDKSGDWQFDGTANNPSDIFGTWKAAVRKVDETVSPAAVSVVPDPDPVRNNWNLGPGADPVPPGFLNEGYGAEVRWNLNDPNLKDNNGRALVPNRTYRLQVIVHDGDQNKTGGDTGEGCANTTFDQQCFTTPTPTPTPTGSTVTDTPTPTPTNTPTNTPTTVVVGGADLSITKTASPTTICINTVANPAVAQTSCRSNSGDDPCGGTPTDITYTSTVTNNGPDPASSVTVSDPLPTFTHFSSCKIVTTTSPLADCAVSGLNGDGTGTVNVNVGSMASGDSAIITIVVTVDAESMFGSSVTQISNTANVSSSTTDPNSSNDSSMATTSVTYCGLPFVRYRPNQK